MSLYSYTFLSVFAVSLASLAGAVLLSLHKTFLQKALIYLVSFAIGALFANVFLHLLPEAVEISSDIHQTFSLVLVGLLLTFIIEKFVHWHHCHNLSCTHSNPVGTMMLIGDGVHNITDGVLIAATYLVDIELGIATTTAVILHEIPQEIGDFAVLIHSGYSRTQALLWNFFSALTAFLGAIAVFMIHDHVANIEQILLPLTAGNFLYIAGSDLIPELHKESRIKNAFLQLAAMIGGVMLMYTLLLGGHGHAHEGEHNEHEEEMHMMDNHDDHDEHEDEE